MSTISELNRNRRALQLKSIVNLLTQDQVKKILTAKIFFNSKLIKRSEVDFTKSCIFIMDYDFIGVLSYIGINSINHVNINDDSLSGNNSSIRTSYMIAESSDARYSIMAYDLSDNDPESWFKENYYKKDLIIWRLSKIIGTGTDKDRQSSIDSIKSILEQRQFTHKLDWFFFIGTEQEFTRLYDLKLPIYIVKSSDSNKQRRKVLWLKFIFININ